jgi:hypothetical protein
MTVKRGGNKISLHAMDMRALKGVATSRTLQAFEGDNLLTTQLLLSANPLWVEPSSVARSSKDHWVRTNPLQSH